MSFDRFTECAPLAPSERESSIEIPSRTLVLLVGLPGSGKSTFARTHFPQESIISTDGIRGEFTNNPGNQIISEKAFILARSLAEARLKNGSVAVIDAQNLQESQRQPFIDIAHKQGCKVMVLFLDVPPEISIAQDAARGSLVGAKPIKRRKESFEAARRSLLSGGNVDFVHSITPENRTHLQLQLPPALERSLAEEKEMDARVAEAQTLLAAAEAGFFGEHAERREEPYEIPAGSILCVQDTADAYLKAFLAKHLLPHQVVDVQRIAKRLHTNIEDPAVISIAQYILRRRDHLNLTTVVTVPPGFESGPLFDLKKLPGKDEGFKAPILHASAKELLQHKQLTIKRDAREDEPLCVIGDVQGCATAMREITNRVINENIVEMNAGRPPRKIVFVGDMSDRGPFDAEAAIYIIGLVRRGLAILVKGNHDENLLKGLRGEECKSAETRETVRLLQERLQPLSIKRMIETLEAAPTLAQWKSVAVVHASLPRLPRAGETIPSKEIHDRTHGIRSGVFEGGRAEVYRLRHTTATDGDVLILGGHTHDGKPIEDRMSGTMSLDGSVEEMGTLYGLYYPERTIVTADEPEVKRLYNMLKEDELPTGKDLVTFVEYARQQGMVDVKVGDGLFAGLQIVTYSEITELGNLWENYPVLRNFRGFIMDTEGNIIARPFKKNHKAGIEVSLESLDIVPEKLFEKANGSLAIGYFWKGSWHVATKFSFKNAGYTQPAEEMLSTMNTTALDETRTYLFEIILPNDAHIVDYEGRTELVLLNSIDTSTGKESDWQETERVARTLGTRTAEDLTHLFKGETIAEIYRKAQTPGVLTNIEGLMALYHDKDGEAVLVKIKAREYDDKKFVRDHLKWEKIFDALDPKTLELTKEKREALLKYNIDNGFAASALTSRIEWIQRHYRDTIEKINLFLLGPTASAQAAIEAAKAAGKDEKAALTIGIRAAIPEIERMLSTANTGIPLSQNTALSFIRSLLTKEASPESKIASHAIMLMKQQIEKETAKRGKNSFWLIPQE